MLKVLIRPARPEDLPSITEIYNEAVAQTVATFDTRPVSLEEQQHWLAEHGGSFPVLVAAVDGVVVGWASLSKWSDRCAYANTAEMSLYVLKRFQGRGIGRKLIETITAEGRRAGLHTILARIAEGNAISVHLHEAVGFQLVGVMREVGSKFGKLLDVHLMQKIYE